jgi:predicted RNase H-like HicB family nuclease
MERCNQNQPNIEPTKNMRIWLSTWRKLRILAAKRDKTLIDLFDKLVCQAYHGKKNYVAVIHKEDDSDYGVSFPDFPGCITAGSSLEEVKNMASEALEFHIKGTIEDGESIPVPSLLDDIVNNPEYSDALTFIVVPLP